MVSNLKSSLQNFVDWVDTHLKGDEKGEAQIFLDRLFQAFGQGGAKEAGGTLEERVKSKGSRGIRTGFADYVWKPVVLIEMKKRGEDLRKHKQQAFMYWVNLVPKRPRWVILCNFDEFWVYDFNTQMDDPMDIVNLVDLPTRFGPLNFLRPGEVTPKFQHNLVDVTRQAANELAGLFNDLVNRGINREHAQKYVLQCLVTLFSEDIGLLDKFFFTDLLEKCDSGAKAYDLIGGLFMEMNNKGLTEGGQFKGVPYFNGGLFREPVRLELKTSEISRLKNAAKFRWEQVRPEIFGTIFEHSMDQRERHAYGAHFTSASDIMKIVGPTIVEPWSLAIERARTLKELHVLRQKLQNIKVLDPACGSGNFLYIAYREMKRIESLILTKLSEISKKKNSSQLAIGFVSARQFFGMDIKPFAIELAKVTMMIARKLAIDELNLPEQALPLDNMDQNFSAVDALIDNNGLQKQWSAFDIIIGNPPFLGAKKILSHKGGDYSNALEKEYKNISNMVDYCTYWFAKTHDALRECCEDYPFSGRAGLVATQNIRFGDSAKYSTQLIMDKGGVIFDCVQNHPWSGEANVNVSIVNWIKPKNDRAPLPKERKIWFDSSEGMEYRTVKRIISDLSDDVVDISTAIPLKVNTKPKVCYQGVTTGTTEFLLSLEECGLFDSKSKTILKPFLGADEMVSGKGIYRWAFDFTNKSLLEVQNYKKAFEYIKSKILPIMEENVQKAIVKGKRSEINARQKHLQKWWMFWRVREDMLGATKKLRRCIVSPRHGRNHILIFVDPEIILGDALQVFAFEDNYSFGILQSKLHEVWWKKSSKLKNEEDIRYSEKKIFLPFPWPQNPSKDSVLEIAMASKNIQEQRNIALSQMDEGGLRDVYTSLKIPGKSKLRDAHEHLDEVVLKAYGFSNKKNMLSQLFDLNIEISSLENEGKIITGTGLPNIDFEDSECSMLVDNSKIDYFKPF